MAHSLGEGTSPQSLYLRKLLGGSAKVMLGSRVYLKRDPSSLRSWSPYLIVTGSSADTLLGLVWHASWSSVISERLGETKKREKRINTATAEKGSIVLCLALCWQPVNLFPYFPKFNAENPAGLWGRLGAVHSQHTGRLWSYMRQGRSPSRTLISLGCPVSSFEPRRVRHVPPALGPWVGTMDFSSGF